MSDLTDYPSDAVLVLRRREQNLKFINYCPICDKWMKQSESAVNLASHMFTCSCGFKRNGNPTELMK